MSKKFSEMFDISGGINEFIPGLKEANEKKLQPRKLFVRFDSKEDLDDFSDKIGQKVTTKDKEIWYPELNPLNKLKGFINES